LLDTKGNSDKGTVARTLPGKRNNQAFLKKKKKKRVLGGKENWLKNWGTLRRRT